MIAFLSLFLLLFQTPKEPIQDAVEGYWLTEGGKGVIELRNEYVGGEWKLNGTIVWVKEPLGKNGKPKTDNLNPDPKLRSRPIVGLTILEHLEWDGDDEWEGEIYAADEGENYEAIITYEDENTVELRGYIGMPLFGRSQTWTRTKKPQ